MQSRSQSRGTKRLCQTPAQSLLQPRPQRHVFQESGQHGRAAFQRSRQQGIPTEKAKEIVRLVKESKKKTQASIQGDMVRISGKDRDDLQAIIAMLRSKDLGVDLQFTNYRTN